MEERLSDRAFEIGFRYEREYGCCSQCTYAAVKEVLGIGSDDVFKAAYGLAGGSASMGTGNCGAYSGGILAICSRYGREKLADGKSEIAGELCRKLHSRFIEEYGSCVCHDIQKKIFGRSFNFLDAEDVEEFEKAGGQTDKCTSVVGKAAKWVTEILLSEAESKE